MLTTTREYEDDIDLLRYGRFLASYWLLIAGCSLAGAALGLLIASRAPRLYQATATIAVVPPASTSTVALTPVTSRTLIENLTLASEVVTELQLNRQGLTPQTFMRDAVTIQAIPSTNLLRVTVSLPDPTQARLAAAALAQKAVGLSRRIDQDGAVTTRDALKVQMEEAARRLNETQDRLLKFRSSAPLESIAVDPEAGAALGRLSIELETERARLASLEKELARQPAPAASTVFPSAASPLNLLLQYEIAGSRARVSSLERQWATTLAAARDPRGIKGTIELSRLETDYGVNRSVYSELATRYEEASGRVVAITPQLIVADPPVQPDAPQPRRRVRAAVFAAVLGAVVGTLLALVVNRRRTTVP